MLEWWNSLSIISQIFYCIAIPSTLVLLIQTILLFLGLDDDGADDLSGGGDADVSADVDGDGIFDADGTEVPEDISGLADLKIFTLRGIIAFFVVFGWVGVSMDSMDISYYITIPVSFACGVIMMVAIAFLLRAVMRLRNDGNIENRNAVGKSGRVYLTIPASRVGEGKVQVMIQGSYVERNAVTDETEPIPTGSEIIVIGVSGNSSLVVKTK